MRFLCGLFLSLRALLPVIFSVSFLQFYNIFDNLPLFFSQVSWIIAHNLFVYSLKVTRNI